MQKILIREELEQDSKHSFHPFVKSIMDHHFLKMMSCHTKTICDSDAQGHKERQLCIL